MCVLILLQNAGSQVCLRFTFVSLFVCLALFLMDSEFRSTSGNKDRMLFSNTIFGVSKSRQHILSGAGEEIQVTGFLVDYVPSLLIAHSQDPHQIPSMVYNILPPWRNVPENDAWCVDPLLTHQRRLRFSPLF